MNEGRAAIPQPLLQLANHPNTPCSRLWGAAGRTCFLHGAIAPLKWSGATIKGSSICGLYRPGLCVGQLAKLAFSGSPRKLAVVLPKPAKEEIDCLLGHIDNVSDTAAELIVSAQIVRLCGQVFIDRLPNALKQEFRLGRRVEKAVKSPVSFKTCTLPCSVDSHWITGRTRAA